jgi:hypothetical protein
MCPLFISHHLRLARIAGLGGLQATGLGGPVNPFLTNLKESL